jgi:hypothetical protein
LWYYRRHTSALSSWKVNFEQQTKKKIAILKDAYASTKSKEVVEYVNIYEKRLQYYHENFYKLKIVLYVLIKHPYVFTFLSKKLLTYPIRKIYGYFFYKV